MGESLLVRVKRIVSGNMFEVADRLEKSQAEIVMKEAIREIERAMGDVRSEQGRSMVKSKQIENHIALLNAKIAELLNQTQIALAQNRDDLAKAAIARQIEFEAQISDLDSAYANASAEQFRLAECVVALTGRKREMDELLKTLDQSHSMALETGCSTGNSKAAAMHRADNASAAFNRAAEGALCAGGVLSVGSDNSAKLAELEKLSFNQKVEIRLQATKHLLATRQSA